MRTVYTVQALCTGMGWVNTKHESDSIVTAVHLERDLLANDAAWMPGLRQTRIVERVVDEQAAA